MRATVYDGLRYLLAGVLLVLAVWCGSAWLDQVLSAEPGAAPDTARI